MSNESTGFDKLTDKLSEALKGYNSVSDLEVKNENGNYWQRVRRTSDIKELINEKNND